MRNSMYDLIGIGIGPANLSVSALLKPVKKLDSLFLEKRPSFTWHKGMLLDEAYLQVSFLKDLVSLVDPTNPFSFINFLAKTNRLYRFSISGINQIKRKEFNQYYNWVIDQMDNLLFDQEVLSIKQVDRQLMIETSDNAFFAKNIVLGVGLKPCVPKFASIYLNNQVFHSSQFLLNKHAYHNKRVMVVGGGQSGAEILYNLLQLPAHKRPKRIDWITKRYNFLPMDDSPFTNELYTPNYCEHFFGLPKDTKKRLVEEQVLTSDGISEALLKSIYEKLYDIEVIDGMPKICHFNPSCELEAMTKRGNSFELEGKNLYSSEKKSFRSDIVIFATGYQERIPECMEKITGAFRDNDRLVQTNDDFSLPWDGEKDNKIFFQNGARNIWGVSSPNLSLNAWRSAKIINSMLGIDHYKIEHNNSVFELQNNTAVLNNNNVYPTNKIKIH